MIFGRDDEFAFVADAVFGFVGRDGDFEKVFHRRDDDFFLVPMNLAVVDHDRLNPKIRDMFFGDVEFEQFRRAGPCE